MKHLSLALFAWLVLIAPLRASEGFPALHDVTGVADDDVLNIRAEPDAQSAELGALPHDATGIEVIRTRDGWGLVNTDERSGWAAMRHLVRQDGEGGLLTQRFTCFGTEPFWSLSATQGHSATLTTPSDPPRVYAIGPLQSAANRSDRASLSGMGADGQGMNAAIRRAACSDGMSDRAFGLDIDLLLSRDDGPRHLSGCCSLRAP